MVSEQSGTSPTSHCQWNNCPRSSHSFDNTERLFDHVLEAHIPTIIKNEDDEEKVICEWNDCQMGTTRGHVEKKTDWMKDHFKTRHVKSAKTCKCLFEGCDVVKATNRELESHVRMVHLAKPKKEKKKTPVQVIEKKETNHIWKIVNGHVVWQKPPKVTKKTIVYYEDGPRYVYPKGHERDSESDWELSEEEIYERAPPRISAPGIIPKPNEKGPFIRPDKSLRKKKSAEKIGKERKEVEMEKDAERKKRGKEGSYRPTSYKPEAATEHRRDVNDNIIVSNPSDAFDGMPALKAYYEDFESEIEVMKPPAAKPEKKVTFNDTPLCGSSPVKPTQMKKLKKAASKPKSVPSAKTVMTISKPAKPFEVVKKPVTLSKSSSSPVKVKKIVKVQQKRSPISKDVSIISKPKMKTSPKAITSKIRKLSLGKRPSRACRVLGSMEEVPFEIEIEVEFEKPKKLIKS